MGPHVKVLIGDVIMAVGLAGALWAVRRAGFLNVTDFAILLSAGATLLVGIVRYIGRRLLSR